MTSDAEDGLRSRANPAESFNGLLEPAPEADSGKRAHSGAWTSPSAGMRVAGLPSVTTAERVVEPQKGAPVAPKRRARGSTAERGLPGVGVSLGRIFGVEIQVDWSLLIIFTLVMVSLGTAVLPGWHPDWTPALNWSVAFGAAFLFFASVLAHELSHAIVAGTQGVPVKKVTLFLFGGVAHMEDEPPTPKAEFLIAIVGPLVSFGIGLCAWLLGSVLASPVLSSMEAIEEPVQAMSKVGPLATLLLWLGPVNMSLGLFNLVPGFPLDGGRVLRSILWWRTGNLMKASAWASRAGQAFAWILMGIGAWNLLGGGIGQGLWLVLIGWFLNNAARMSYERLLVREALDGVGVLEMMFSRLEPVPPQASAQELIDDYFMTSDQRAFPVISETGRFLGLVCFEDVRKLPREQRASTKASDLMTPVADLISLPPDAEARSAVDLLARREVDQIPVLEEGRLVGLVRRRDVLKWLALRNSELRLADSRLAGA